MNAPNALVARARAALDAGASPAPEWRRVRSMIPPAGPGVARATDARMATAIDVALSCGGPAGGAEVLARFVNHLEAEAG